MDVIGPVVLIPIYTLIHDVVLETNMKVQFGW